jgi:gliding motility-associated-like protein
MLKKYFIIVLFFYLSFFIDSYAQTTSIPDPNFEQALIDLNIDSDGIVNQQVLTSDISGQTSLDVNSKGIGDLTGIEGFSSLTFLDCSNNQLTNLNVSQNENLTQLICFLNKINFLQVRGATSLELLKCENNALTGLDVSQNANLTLLHCNANALTSLNISGAINLIDLECIGNNLGTIDLSNNQQITNFRCSDNLLVSLDTQNNPNLETYYCGRNLLTSIDLSNNPSLTELECGGNQLEFLDISLNTDLTRLECNDNRLQELDLSQHTALKKIECHNNVLTTFNLRNGNNILISDFDSRNNPNLNCIMVDDADYAQNTWTQKDPWTYFSEDCTNVILPPTAVNDAYDTSVDNTLNVQEINGVLLNDSDPKGRALTAVLNSTVSQGNLTLLPNGSFTYIPDSGFSGTDTFTYMANNGKLNSSIATVTINIEETPDNNYIVAPNGFTPNEDGINDYFKPVYHGMLSVRMEIYNTWGNLIYVEENSNLTGWNGFVKGKQAENGNYLYKISALSNLNEEIVLEAMFTLIR